MAVLTGTAAADTQLGTTLDDSFYASAGDDKIWGGTGGFDRLFLSGKFHEYAVRDNGNGSYTLTHYRPGGDGVDIIRDIDSFVFSDRTVSLTELIQQAYSVVSGTGGNDDLLGTGKNDRLEGGAGDDHIWGGTAGSDLAVYSGNLSDYKISANGNGSYTILDLRGIDGVDVVRDIELFQFANETIDLDALMALMPKESHGTEGDDNQIGSSGNDRFFASGGNDRIWGTGQGDDLVIYSGNFADYAIIDNRDGSYTVVDTRTGSPDGADKVRDIGTFQFADRAATLREFLSAHPTGFIFDGQGTAGDDVMHGSAGDDVLHGNGGRDRIWGGKGGIDTVVFTGNLADYIITDNTNGAFWRLPPWRPPRACLGQPRTTW
jgi:large repetitive protein